MEEKKCDDALLRETNRRIARVMRLHHRLCEKRLAALPIHRAQHMILMRLAKEGKLPSQKELAEQMEISSAAVTVAVKKLEAGGYIMRCANQSDCRINAISITDAGRNVVWESRRIFDALDIQMYEGISKEELALFKKTLDKISENLSAVLEDTQQ